MPTKTSKPLKKPGKKRPVHCDPDIMGGTPVFVGTRVPVQNLFDYLDGNYPLQEFLDDFPTVSPEQAGATLKLACTLVCDHAYSP